MFYIVEASSLNLNGLHEAVQQTAEILITKRVRSANPSLSWRFVATKHCNIAEIRNLSFRIVCWKSATGKSNGNVIRQNLEAVDRGESLMQPWSMNSLDSCSYLMRKTWQKCEINRPCVYSASDRNQYQKQKKIMFPGSRKRPVRRTDSIAAICEPTV
jgi:hypothetical protein